MYQVIIVLDEKRNKSYYFSYTESDDVTLGNITVDDLPPYQDINKAKACYYDSENNLWIFDSEKYAEIIAENEAMELARKQEEAEKASIPTNEELMLAIMEIAQGQSDLESAVIELADLVAEQGV